MDGGIGLSIRSSSIDGGQQGRLAKVPTYTQINRGDRGPGKSAGIILRRRLHHSIPKGQRRRCPFFLFLAQCGTNPD